MMDWLLDTIVWTAALIALVLVLRRPVARWFGPQVAYSLWLLPILRVVLPPIELPAWMAPTQDALPATPLAAASASEGEQFVLTLDAEPVATASESWFASLPLTEIAVGAWLIGAAVFLYSRLNGYAQMRAEMLANGREVGRQGKVRFIETPATNSPLAFGVSDKVIALPKGFLAHHDREARDLALAHELAHHEGHDLLVNFLAQPLFAMHWFNPLGRLGWLALRRDQEAACDARVVEGRGAATRATYATVIASFAAGPNAALAAPMACPVLGDKSIIQRLRSLNMNDLSARRRLAGRGLMAAALVALPLTASISYAASDAMPAPPAPPAAPAAPNAPVPPAPPVPPAAPDAPLPPLAPVAFQSSADVDVDEDVDNWELREVIVDKDGKRKEIHKRHKVVIKDGDKMTAEERAELRRELRQELAEADMEIKEAMEEARVALLEVRNGEHGVTSINMECKNGKGGEFIDDKGHKTVMLCTSEIMANALTGLKEARKAIAKDSEMTADMKAEVLRALDEQIANWNNKQG